jgi:hypothetical protein
MQIAGTILKPMAVNDLFIEPAVVDWPTKTIKHV